MILSNYYKWLSDVKRYNAIETEFYNLQDLTSIDGVRPQWLITGNTSSAGSGNSSYNRNMGSGISVKLGSGGGTPSKNSYRIDSDVTSSFNVSVQTAFSTESGNSIQIFTITGTNTSSDIKTIKQIGICKDLKNSAGNESTFLFAIHLLDSQLSVAPGESFTKVIKWIDE